MFGVVVAVALLMSVVGGVAIAQYGDDDGVLWGCAKKNNGQLRLVPNGDECNNSEVTVWWNQTGVAGDRGPQGDQGLSAYEVAVAEGFAGTVGEWLEALVGRDGADGEDGAPGLDGVDGIHCWDLDGNGTGDLPDEDRNGDLAVDVHDCTGPTGADGAPGQDGASCTLVDNGDDSATLTCPDGSSVLIPTIPTSTPSIRIEKHTIGHDADIAPGPRVVVGDAVIWTYEVHNVGDVPLVNIAVVDDQLGNVATLISSGNGDSLLDPGETWVFMAEGEAVEGQYENLGTAKGTPVDPADPLTPIGPDVTDDDPSHYLGVTIDLQIENEPRDVNGNPLPPGEEGVVAGEDFVYRLTVKNVGAAAATGVRVLDLLPPRLVGTDPPLPFPFDQFPAFSGVGDSFFEIDNPDISPFSERQATQGVTYNGFTAPAGVTCFHNNGLNAVRCSIGEVNVGETVIIDLELTMDPFARVRVWNRAWVFGNETLDGSESNLDKSDPASLCGSTGHAPGDVVAAEAANLMGVGCNYVKKNVEVDR